MKVTLNWLKQYVDFDWSPDELSERLTMLGVEVEGIVRTGADFPGVVVAQVLAKDRHPNADKLSVCMVNDGKGQRQIVCGAHNFQAGDKVPLVLPGSTLPGGPGGQPFTIKVGKIRGVESHGMLCSPQELGLPDQIDGLLVLRPDATVGQPFAQYLGGDKADVVYDLEITPNRPDLNSVIGIAREISALTGNPLKLPDTSVTEPAGGKAEVEVRLEDPELCPRYTARVLRGVKIGSSPEWLRTILEKVGIRSINNVVDVTNYVMMETGQPLHAFDLHLLAKPGLLPAIVVRRARDGEKFVTLDAQQRNLKPDMLLIADETKGVALAGIMGGQNSEIQDTTHDVLLESACFKPQNIRATSKRLELRTESSYRFERGSDISICEWASRRAAKLIIDTAGGSLTSPVVDAYPTPAQPKQITLRHHKVNELLGLQLSPEQIDAYLEKLELRPAVRKPRPVGQEEATNEPVTFKIPTFRVDLKREVDLIEEVARLYGVDRIPSTPPRGALGANAFDAKHDEYAEARRILAGLGLHEAQGQTLISDSAAKLVSNSSVPLANPLSSDMNVLRPGLLPGLLDALKHNLSRRTESVALFEVGRVFVRKGNDVAEQRKVAIAITGSRNAVFWSGSERDAKADAWDLKGILEEFFDQIGLKGCSYAAANPEQGGLFIEAADINLGKLYLGQMGQLSPPLLKSYDLRDPVWLAELDLDMVLYRRSAEKNFKPLPAFPSIRRDIAMLVPETVTHEAVMQTVKQSKPAFLEAVELFDVFRGKNVPAGRKSMAYAFTYRNPERTLTDAEVNTSHAGVVEALKKALEAAVRE